MNQNLQPLCHAAGFIRNFEAEVYGREQPFVEPMSVIDGLAIYRVGRGAPVLLFPYPHGHTIEPMAQGPLASSLIGLQRSIVTFDVPGAYRSIREPRGDMAEMIQCADETLDWLTITERIDIVGHSMGGLAALAYAIERPARIRRLLLVTSLSGFPAAVRWGFPGSAFRIYERDYWRVILWDIRLNVGRGTLALHKRLQNLMEGAAYHNKACFTPVAISPEDVQRGVPVRTIWTRNLYRRLSYAARLAEVQAPTLVLAGRHDPETPLPCATELVEGIPQAQLVIFEQSGHYPFQEESAHFASIVGAFLHP